MPKDIFVSRPTMIAKTFEAKYAFFEKFLKLKGYRPRRLGADGYTLDVPLKGVIDFMKKCHGAIILGYPQYQINANLTKAGKQSKKSVLFYRLCGTKLRQHSDSDSEFPFLVFAHEGVSGGLFDYGVTGEYVHTTNLDRKYRHKSRNF